MSPKYKDTIEFLIRVHHDRRWVLTALHPDNPKSVHSATFSREGAVPCTPWLEKWGKDHNLYYGLGEVLSDLTSKAKRQDIHAVHYLHADLDPRVGEELLAEQERIKKLLTGEGRPDVLPSVIPMPTAIICSGSGFQALWLLDKPLEVVGSSDAERIASADDIGGYNRTLELALGGDHCFDVSRILRLPGTINYPSAKKKERGRVEALAELIEFDPSRVYKIEQFTKTDVEKKKPTDTSVVIDARRVADLDTLGPKLSVSTKCIIVNGYDVMDKELHGWPPDRSKWLFRAVCQLLRAGVEEAVILGIITDPAYKISQSILELRSAGAIQRYAQRQIERAAAVMADPKLDDLNNRFAVVESVNGKCRIIEEQWDESLNRSRLVMQTFEDFRNRYCNIKIGAGTNSRGEEVEIPIGHWWCSHPQRRQYDRIIFLPGSQTEKSYNMWRGFGCEPAAGNCDLFLSHIRENICCGEDAKYNYLISWMANAVQNPASPGQVAVCMKGDQGTGKGFFAQTFGGLFGRHFLQVVNAKHLTGNFNSHLRDVCVLFADEAVFAPDRSHASVLKTLVTEERIVIELKGIDAESFPNYIHLIMASNDHFVVPAGIGERRFFVVEVSNAHKDDHTYFEAISAQLDSGGREALLHMLQNMNLEEFNVRDFPKTKELQGQKNFGMGTEDSWFSEKLRDGRLLPEHDEWRTEITEAEFYHDYILFCQSSSSFRKMTRENLLNILRKYISIDVFRTHMSIEIPMANGELKMVPRPRMLRLPPLAECRRLWTTRFGGTVEWELSDNETLFGETHV
jgi:hypothetical protein